jgi:hypothetical protein
VTVRSVRSEAFTTARASESRGAANVALGRLERARMCPGLAGPVTPGVCGSRFHGAGLPKHELAGDPGLGGCLTHRSGDAAAPR